MKTIRKTYQSMAQAGRYQNRLYGRFTTVRLVSWPRFSEAGVYVWEVA